MKTEWMLMGRYDGLPIIPVKTVVEDFFGHLTPAKFLRKASDGHIRLPLVKMEDSQKSAKGVHLKDLAIYLDKRHDESAKDFDRLHS